MSGDIGFNMYEQNLPIAPSGPLGTVQTSTPAPLAFLPRLAAAASVGELSWSQP